MAKHPTYFSQLYTATVRAGEKSGALVDVLIRFITYQKKMIAVMTKLKMSLAYPIFLVLALVVVLGIFFLYVIPNFTQMYSDQAGKLPFLTSLLIDFTGFLTRFTPYILSGLVAAGVAIYSWQKTVAGRNTLDSIKLKIPLIQSIITQYLLAQITRTLATVLRAAFRWCRPSTLPPA